MSSRDYSLSTFNCYHMKRLFSVSMIIFVLLSSCSLQDKSLERGFTVDDQWKFSTGDNMGWSDQAFDDNDWAVISIKSGWESQGYEDYDGYAWYRKEIFIPGAYEDYLAKKGGIIICYDSADDVDELFFNGFSAGTTGSFPPGYEGKHSAPRKYRIPAEHIQYDRQNTIAIRVFDNGGGGGLITREFLIRPKNSVDAVTYTFSLPAEEWVFMADDPQQVEVNLANSLDEKVNVQVVLLLQTDKHEPVDSIAVPVELNPSEVKSVSIPFALPDPGFYRCSLFLENKGYTGDTKKFNIGYKPEEIISPRDAKDDFETFWKETRMELDKVDPAYKITLVPEKSTGAKNIYRIEMTSFGHVPIEGYYAVPKAKGRYPAIISYMGYGSDGYYPHTDGNPGYAEFVLSVRGQGFLKPDNIYNSDWITYGLESKESYYYRGAFMDLVRGVDFLVSRPEVDSKRIVAEGGSQGGAFTLAACALDKRILAGAPTIPFLSDYRDYFAIVSWPRSDFERYFERNPSDTWERVYDLLTYFDIKNLAQWIECPIIMGVGLQDEVCPPHTNFSSYNLIKSEKEYRIYHDHAHSTPESWYRFRTEFFDRQTGGLKVKK